MAPGGADMELGVRTAIGFGSARGVCFMSGVTRVRSKRIGAAMRCDGGGVECRRSCSSFSSTVAESWVAGS